MSRDYQRSKVYRSEDQLQCLVQHAAYVELSGVSLQLEPERRFVSLAEVQAYVDRITVHPGVIGLFGVTGPVAVRARKGHRKAHYERVGQIIAIPFGGTNWALRELLVLHELAHHYAPSATVHGPEFTSALADLLGVVIGPQIALALRLLYRAEGVR